MTTDTGRRRVWPLLMYTMVLTTIGVLLCLHTSDMIGKSKSISCGRSHPYAPSHRSKPLLSSNSFPRQPDCEDSPKSNTPVQETPEPFSLFHVTEMEEESDPWAQRNQSEYIRILKPKSSKKESQEGSDVSSISNANPYPTSTKSKKSSKKARPILTDGSTQNENIQTPEPTPIPITILNKIVTCIAVIDESSVDYNDLEREWADLRSVYDQRPFCLLQPQNSNGSPGKDDLAIPPGFENDTIANDFNVSRDEADKTSPSDWYKLCGLDEQRSNGIGRVAFFIDDSWSLNGLEAVQTSFNLLQDNLHKNGFKVVSGQVNDREDWITPCRTSIVLDNQTSIECNRNTDCLSNICVDEFCKNEFQGLNERCDENDDCQNLACGHPTTFDTTIPKICCPSHTALNSFCTGQQIGAECNYVDAYCDSGFCVEGFCRENLNDAGETCDDDDQDCANESCGRESYPTGEFVCCPSEEVIRANGDNWCAGHEAGAGCPVNEVCASGVCVGGNCTESLQAVGQPCDEDDHDDCANDACGRETYPDGNFICCASNSSFGIESSYYRTGSVCTGLSAGSKCGTFNELCVGVCVNGTCTDGLQAPGEPCDEDDHKDCVNDACGRETYPDGKFICCTSNSSYATRSSYYRTGSVCTGQSAGSECGTFNELCAVSCVNGTCTDGLQAPGEPCDEDDHDDCANDACGRVTYPDGKFICCTSNSSYPTVSSYYRTGSVCTGQSAGSECGTFDEVCASGVCQGGFCA